MLYGNTTMVDNALANRDPLTNIFSDVVISSTANGREMTWLKKMKAFVAALVMLMWKVNTIRKKMVRGTNSIAKYLSQFVYDSLHFTHLKLGE